MAPLSCTCFVGAPHYVRDLSGVAAGQARTIVILNPEDAVVSVLASQVVYHARLSPDFVRLNPMGESFYCRSTVMASSNTLVHVLVPDCAISCILHAAAPMW